MKTTGSWRSRNPVLANVVAVAIAAVLVGFGAYGVLHDDLPVPGWRRQGGTLHYYHFHGLAAWLMFAGLACVGASIVLAIARRLTARPSGLTDERMAVMMATAGVFIIMAMMILKWVDLV